MYADHAPCSVCGSEVRLRPHPGASATPAAQHGPAGPVDGVVGGGDPTVDVRECTNEHCPTREPDGPDA